MARSRGLVGWVIEEAQERLGYSVAPTSRLNALEEGASDARSLRAELRRLAYSVQNAWPLREREMPIETRRKLVGQSRIVWQKDPMAGQATDLLNDFVFGKGIPKPKAKDPEVQKVIDDFWDDPDNQRTLTSHTAQLAFGTDLSLQSNLFFLVFDDGADGKVKVSFLEHDSVRNAVRDENDRFCPLWYLADRVEETWDFTLHGPRLVQQTGRKTRDDIAAPPVRTADDQTRSSTVDNVLYYEHVINYENKVEVANQSPSIKPPLRPPDGLIGVGRVYHVAENRLTEMVFGHPRMDRTLRWYSAYNSFMEARVDMMRAAAALVMKRKSDASPAQIAKQTLQSLSRASEMSIDTDAVMGPKPAGILNENMGVTHEAFKIPSGGAEAVQDAGQLRAQVSAGTGFPPTYFGDLSSGSLATSTSLELPVLKRCESRSELVEATLRFMVDRAIKRAVEVGTLKETLTAEEVAAKKEEEAKLNPDPNVDVDPLAAAGGDPFSPQLAPQAPTSPPRLSLVASFEDQEFDEEQTQRDLTYELTMPNPLRRALGDIIQAIQQVATTFDPTGTNTDLARVLMLIALQELEVQDAAEMVEKIFPPGYQSPALAATQAGPAVPGAPEVPGAPPNPNPNPFEAQQPGAIGPDGRRHGQGNAYGAPMRAQSPEDAMRMRQAAITRPDGSPALREAAWWRPDDERSMVAERIAGINDEWERQVGPLADRALAALSGD